MAKLDKVAGRKDIQKRSEGRYQCCDECHDRRNERPHETLYAVGVMTVIVWT